MTSFDHSLCRREIVEGEISPASGGHLAECRQCALFARRFGDALRAAPGLAPPMPSGLAGRVIERVRAERSALELPLRLAGPPGPSREPPARSPILLPPPQRRGNRVKGAIAVAAAIALLLAALVFVPRLAGVSGSEALRSAAARTESRGTARTAVRESVEGTSSSESGAAAQAAPDFSVVVDAEGDVAFHSRLLLRGSVRVSRAGSGVGVDPGQFQVVEADGRSFDLGPEGLAERSADRLPLAPLSAPDTVLDVISVGRRASVEDLGETEMDGVAVHGYRFAVGSTVLRAPFRSATTSSWTTEAWIGVADGVLRRFTASSTGRAVSPTSFTWRAAVTVRLFDFGMRVRALGELPGTLAAEDDPVLPLPATVDLSRFAGRAVRGRSVLVQSVVADEGFWVGSGVDDRVFVHLLTKGESRPHVTPGARLSFVGVMRPNPPDLDRELGVDRSEGAGLLRREGYHVEVRVEDLGRG